MSVQVISKKVYRCKCEWPDCRKEWDAETADSGGNSIGPPKRCSSCKRFTWNDKNGHQPVQTKAPSKAVKLPKPRRVRSYDE
jgi:hypothetical protein